MKRKLVAILTVLLLLVYISPAVSHADELTGLTLEKEMRAMMELGIVKGHSDGKVYPKADVSRGDFAAFLARTMDLPKEIPAFTDVNTSSAIAGEIGAIQKTGIMKGTLDGKFMPLKLMTREEMAVTTARALTYLGLSVESSTIILSDQSKFSMAEGAGSSKVVFAAGIMNGIKVNASRTEITFDPKGLSKRDQVAAVLKRFLDFVEQNKGGIPEEKPPIPPVPPVVDATKFQLATIDNKKLVLLDKTYNTYVEAVSAFNASATAQGIYKGKELLRVKSGMAFAQGPTGQNTIIYSSPAFTTQSTYIEAGREMRILEHAENYMKVQVADTVGYVKHNQIDFMPTAILDSRDYYIANTSNELIHFTFNYLSKTYGSFSIGPAPSFMTSGVKYYATDGVHFLDEAGKAIGTHYPYFQFQSIRTKTSYTAEELDAFIVTKLAEQEATGIARYAGASTKSKLIGLGAYIKQMETEHRVNGLFILATAIHESDYGISNNAMTKNNLFGIKVFDSTPEAGEKYATPSRSIEAFVMEYANKNYGPPSGAYAKGAAPGNKTAGINAHYASDPTWGSKVAGHMWRMDKALGARDFGKHELAMTTTTIPLNARTVPAVSASTLLFTYKERDLGRSGETGYPLVILEQATGSDNKVWYKVLSDDLSREFVWIHSDYVRKLPK
ncbi:glucosaminidase domain-containing protein [Sporosarcina sp. BP05]|uniref:glucosaminidase domain-containing protein n=1 Tax=Sporosarcina sp. BP05 TaxID=2758726 RepID=UPI0016483647|nr:glucosaminidase domain-containing protein [Sporosarcina sp. BP05]